MSNFKTAISLLLALLLAFGVPTFSYAGYAQLKIPSGWLPPKTIGATATFRPSLGANDAVYKGSTVLTNSALELGGSLVTVPVSMRLAANAATVAATFSFGNPALFAAMAVGSAAYLYYQEKGLEPNLAGWTKAGTPGCSASPCYEYSYTIGATVGPYLPGTDNAFLAALKAYKPSNSATYTTTLEQVGSCVGTKCTYRTVSVQTYPGTSNPPYTSYSGENIVYPDDRLVQPYAPSPRLPVALPEFHEIMDPVLPPVGLPKLLPDIDWPYEQPVINPDPSSIPATNPSPALRPEPRPVWVPTGDPLKNPNPEPGVRPDTWTQPGKDVKPSGTPSDPWRVDVTDAPKTKGDPSPNIDTPTPTTTTPTPTEFQTCGLPGKPKCLIDETGTPTYDSKKVQLDKATLEPAASSQRDKVSAPGDKSSIFQGFSQFFSLPPLAACTPVVMPSIAGQQIASMDVCPGAEWLRGLMGFVWAVAGFLFVFRTVEDVI